MDVRMTHNGTSYRVRRDAPGTLTVVVPGDEPQRITMFHQPNGSFAVLQGSGYETAEAARDGEWLWVRWRGRTYRLRLERGGRAGGSAAPRGGLEAPMPGQVQKILVAVGDAVAEGQPLMVMEAMKMQIEIKAPQAGRVKRLLAAEGETVPAGRELVDLEEAE